jgi:hypothetical protein
LPNKAFEPVRFRYRLRETVEKGWAAASTLQIAQLGRVRLVAAHIEEDRDDEPRFYVCNYLQLDLSYLLGQRKLRWPVETCYDDAKGPLDFDTYELRDGDVIRRDWTLVLVAYSAARRANAQGSWGIGSKRRSKTIGNITSQAQSEALAAFIYKVAPSRKWRKDTMPAAWLINWFRI